ncbi:hypothetical protein RYZ27_10110 [Hyphomonas sp. FCG-A18]|uniref:hypothetical protein n=1 Tax=Hyphomonas sp. FCG-A18 TaxID=3080019 RepID=UPI002B27F8E7|nr:hypothetical protein RYZ27_10110 [Hyphomonas sp. FCG-A18]
MAVWYCFVMPRQIIALLIAFYAIAFAFGAMAAIRWPSIMMFAALVLEKDPLEGLPAIDWRELGIVYGAPYFLAALSLYASALTVGQRARGGVLWYIMGCTAGFPCVFLVDFETGWWRDPSVGEGAVAGAAAGAILLGIAVWLLRQGQKPKGKKIKQEPTEAPAIIAPLVSAKKPLRRPVAPAIARQRAHFAAEGRKMMAKRYS